MNSMAAQKGGIASGLARQSPKLTADKAKAVELHLAGCDTGQIQHALPHRQRSEIRRWLITKGIYKTAGRGKATKGKRFYNPTRLILAEYASEFKQIRKTDELNQWRNHPAIDAYKALGSYYKNHDKILARLKVRYVNTSEQIRIKKLLSSRIHKAITRNGHGARKAASTMELIGCTIAEVRAHLESKFLPRHDVGQLRAQWMAYRPYSALRFFQPCKPRSTAHLFSFHESSTAMGSGKHFKEQSLARRQCGLAGKDSATSNIRAVIKVRATADKVA